MSAISRDQSPRISVFSKGFESFSKIFGSLKDSIYDHAKNTAIKIKEFIQKNAKNIFFAILSAFALIHGPYRFLFTFFFGLTVQKISYNNHLEIVTSNSLALNILAIMGVVLEKTICPVCDPTYYLAPCISGIATADAAYNLYQNISREDLTDS